MATNSNLKTIELDNIKYVTISSLIFRLEEDLDYCKMCGTGMTPEDVLKQLIGDLKNV